MTGVIIVILMISLMLIGITVASVITDGTTGTTTEQDYDQILVMRKTLFNDQVNVDLFHEAQFEMSIICEVEIVHYTILLLTFLLTNCLARNGTR